MPPKKLHLSARRSWAHVSLGHSTVPLFRVWVTSTRMVTMVGLSPTASVFFFDNVFSVSDLLTRNMIQIRHYYNIYPQGLRKSHEILSKVYVVIFLN
jgi:hypothetical protein